MKKSTSFFAVALTVALSSFASASSLEYRLLINGAVQAFPFSPPAGTHTLTVEGRVVDNDLTPGNAGGIFQAAVNLAVEGLGKDALVFTQGKLPITNNPDGKWAATFAADFNTNFRGEIGTNPSYAVFAHTASIAPGDQGAKFNAVGANVWSPITTGSFTWDGNNTRAAVIKLTAADGLAGQRVAGFDGTNITSVAPTTVVETFTTVGVPEPTSFGLAGFAALGLAAIRRRLRA